MARDFWDVVIVGAGAAGLAAAAALVQGKLQRRTPSLLGQVREAFTDSGVLASPDQSLESFLTGAAGRKSSEPARASSCSRS
jgi:aspartate oxidase